MLNNFFWEELKKIESSEIVKMLSNSCVTTTKEIPKDCLSSRISSSNCLS